MQNVSSIAPGIRIPIKLVQLFLPVVCDPWLFAMKYVLLENSFFHSIFAMSVKMKINIGVFQSGGVQPSGIDSVRSHINFANSWHTICKYKISVMKIWTRRITSHWNRRTKPVYHFCNVGFQSYVWAWNTTLWRHPTVGVVNFRKAQRYWILQQLLQALLYL